MNPARREALRNYFLIIASDLVSRGRARHLAGESMEAVLRRELAIVIEEVQGDLAEIAMEILGAGTTAMQSALHRHVEGLVGAGFRFVAGMVAGGRKR